MSLDPKEGGVCWSCRRPVAAEDNFCRFCGKDLRAFPWYYQHWGIVLAALFLLGPFALLLVWRSPLLSRRMKWGYTAALGGLTYWVLLRCWQAWLAVKAVMAGAGL